MASSLQTGDSQLLLWWLLAPSRVQGYPGIEWKLQISLWQASQVARPQLLLERGGAKVPLVGLALQLAGGLESVSSFIEMLPQLCPSSGFQSLQPPGPAFLCSLRHPGNSSW